MSYFPPPDARPDLLISAFSRWSVGAEMDTNDAGAPASLAWPTANKAIYVPLYLPVSVMVTKLWWGNGATASGNVDCGIYRYSDLSRVVSAGSTAQAGTSVLQEKDITDTLLSPGTYYMALAMDGTTGTGLRLTYGGVENLKTIAVAEQTTAFALPATAVPVHITSAYLPFFGISARVLTA